MNRFLKWLYRNKKRHYKVTYVATGFMGNQYEIDTFEFDVSDAELKKSGHGTIANFGFHKNYKVLSRHFKITNGTVSYSSRTFTLSNQG